MGQRRRTRRRRRFVFFPVAVILQDQHCVCGIFFPPPTGRHRARALKRALRSRSFNTGVRLPALSFDRHGSERFDAPESGNTELNNPTLLPLLLLLSD